MLTRRDFMKVAGYATLSAGVAVSFAGSDPVKAQSNKVSKSASNSQYNILMIVTDQERHMKVSELPISFQLPGHERLAKRGVVFENHQIAAMSRSWLRGQGQRLCQDRKPGSWR